MSKVEAAAARKKIERLFIEQCQSGAQSTDLPAPALACGQFIGSDAIPIQQRGFHGTAAAILVLSRSAEPEAPDVVKGLVTFISLCMSGEERVTDASLRRDLHNTIKQAELLYSLSFVPSAVSQTEQIRTQIADRLISSQRQPSGGWAYFLDETSEPVDPIPTAYAVMALAREGHKDVVDSGTKYLLDIVKTRSDIDSVTSLLIQHALGETLDRESSPHRLFLRDKFKHVRAVLEAQFVEQVEQNIEYWHSAESLYVRIPWQLYYVCIENRLASASLWPSAKSNNLLQQSVRDAAAGHFKYPHSGRMLSSRSNSILYQVTQSCLTRRKTVPYQIALSFDTVRDLFGRKAVRLTLVFAAAVLVLLSGVDYFAEAPRFRDFAPEIFATVLIAALGLAKSR